MTKELQHRRGTSSEHSGFKGAPGEITVDTNKFVAVVHDNQTFGGHELVGVAATQTVRNKTIIAGAGTTTGTASQPLQVVGGAYVSGSVGIGTTRPTSTLQVVGDGNFTGVVTATTFRGNIIGAAATFTGNVSIAGTLTYEDVTNVDSVGLVTARAGAHVATSSGNLLVGTANSTGTASQPLQVVGGAYVSGSVGIGTTRPTSTLQVVGGDTRLGGVIETVGTAVTYNSGNVMVVEMDVRQATTYVYTIPTGARIGIVSFRNMPAETGSPSGSTITLLVTQNAAGTGNTTAATGIGTNCTVVGYENGASVAGISTRGLVGSGTTITLSSTGRDRDFIAFFIQYTGETNTTASSYQVYLMKNGSFR